MEWSSCLTVKIPLFIVEIIASAVVRFRRTRNPVLLFYFISAILQPILAHQSVIVLADDVAMLSMPVVVGISRRKSELMAVLIAMVAAPLIPTLLYPELLRQVNLLYPQAPVASPLLLPILLIGRKKSRMSVEERRKMAIEDLRVIF